jgi:hypothetical protein
MANNPPAMHDGHNSPGTSGASGPPQREQACAEEDMSPAFIEKSSRE